MDRKLEQRGQVRVIDAEAALRLCKTRGEGAFVLELRDEQIEENNGRFAIAYADGRVQRVTRTQDAPDVAMGIAAFSRMLVGRCDLDAYPGLPDMQVYGKKQEAAGVFYRKPCYIHTPF